MSDELAYELLSADAHTDTAEAFVGRAWSQHGDEIAELYVFGSTIRDEAPTSSD